MNDPHSFQTEIKAGRGGGAYVEIPFDVKAAFGSARPKVKAIFDKVPYRGSIVTMNGIVMIGVTRDVRAQLGKDVGDRVNVTVELDTEPREVPVPADVRAALDGAGLSGAFDTLAYTHRKEHIRAIAEAKRAATRERRIARMLDSLK